MTESTPAAPILELQNIGHGFTDGSTKRAVLRNINLRIEPEEFVAITGPSGSGKSTLLRVIAGLLPPDEGVVRLHGKDIYAEPEGFRTRLRRRELGFVFQEHNLLEVLSAQENVSLPLELDGMSGKQAAELARTALELVGLGGHAESFPEKMSGGERQRVAIARAIVGERSLLLADEPTGALDSVNGANIVSIIEELCRDAGKTALMVTHNENHAKRASRIVHIVDGATWS